MGQDIEHRFTQAGLPEDEAHALTLAERDTLSHLLNRGMGDNSLRAIRSDLGYLEAWSWAATGHPLDWPPRTETVLRFIAHHLWDPDERVQSADHGMPDIVRHALREGGFLRSSGPHAPATVSRRISTWRAVCRWKGVEGPFSQPEVARTLRAAVRAAKRPRGQHSKRVVDAELVIELLDHLEEIRASAPGRDSEAVGTRLRATRDLALIATMFASGGRRRSEISNLMMSQIHVLDDIQTEAGQSIASIGLRMGRTKTTTETQDARVFLSGRAATALKDWIAMAGLVAGPVFLAIDRWGNVQETSISPAAVNAVVKARLAEIGHDPRDFSAHGVRAGYITSALKQGIPAPEVMEQTLHRSLDTLLGYFKDERQREGRAARLL
ncbi:site-specific tyrosine recombinase XerC [Jannaschia seosinensis]|uniref:Site-specific tyrosine recombinase XerC n=1 Tax=Jannaschia seosinensis TaxID=313367 RepID=A0A0M7BC36_9RHOB|nr:tyrosine-type recombinase/integrase [Jannaschia seosinensis]CUH39384.1 site-specific tyrosine recombinase XerC [Jannaschia seosinensis]